MLNNKGFQKLWSMINAAGWVKPTFAGGCPREEWRVGIHPMACIRLAVLTFLACAVFLPQSASSGTPDDLADMLVQAQAETEARTLRGPDGTPLCFPPAAMVEGTEAHVIPGSRGVGGSADVQEGELSGYIDVRVEETEAPVLLILRGYHSIIWRLHLAEGARLGAVHLMGYAQNFVIGVPADVPVTSRFKHPLIGGEKEYCVFAETDPGGNSYLPPKGMVDESQRFSGRYVMRSFAFVSAGGSQSKSREVRYLRGQLHDHGGVPIASWGGWIDRRPEVSRQTIEKYEAIRQRGRDWLAAHKPPPITLLGPDAETMSIPEGINGIAALEWLAERGYAERTSREIVEYLCGRRLAVALLEGEDLFWDLQIRNCGPRKFSIQMFTILGPIQITEEICTAKDRASLLMPPDVQIDWNRACSWMRFKYPRVD